jgi:hypothetical protein
MDSVVEASYLNASVSSSDPKEVNQQTVNDVYMRSWGEQQYYLTPSDSSILYSIAVQDPLYAGLSVYEARVMLGLDEENYVQYSSARMAEIESLSVSQLKMFPNPASDELTLEYSIGETDVATYQIVNLSGQQVLSGALQSGNTRQISTSSLEQGVYFVILTVNNAVEATEKLVIIRQ